MMIVAIYPLVAVKQNFKIGCEAAVNPLTQHGKIYKLIISTQNKWRKA